MTKETILDIMAEVKEELSKRDKEIAEAIHNGLERQFKAVEKSFQRRQFNEKCVLTEIKEIILGTKEK